MGPLLFALGGCVTWAGPNQAVPPNYRQLVARHVAENTDLSKVLNAEISRPGVWEGPLGLGRMPIACARLTLDGSWSPQTHSIGFTFENGQIADVFYPDKFDPVSGYVGTAIKKSVTCGKLTYCAFTEIRKQR